MQAGGRKNWVTKACVKGGLLAWLLCGKRGIVRRMVEHRGVVVLGSSSVGGNQVYRREGGEETNKYTAITINMHDMQMDATV